MNILAKQMYGWCQDLFPICRSLTGDGVRQTLQYIKNVIPEIEVKSVSSGTKAFDWVIPREWNIREAWIKDSSGKKIVDFSDCNLHVVGYSIPIHAKLTLQELDSHLHFLPDQPDAIPYITSYYAERWGFCLTYQQYQNLKDGEYEVFIDSKLEDGELNYGELLLKGKSKKEILLSTYICHPSMANNELSGPSVVLALVNWLKTIDRNYSYRILFVPETIGSIYYLSQHHEYLKKHLLSGFVVTCIGDDNNYSFVNTPEGNTVTDEVIEYAANIQSNSDYKKYSFLMRGSDERQYCSVGIDLSVVSVCRTKYAEYPEYHTSLDNLNYISPEGLLGGFSYIKTALLLLEKNKQYKSTVLCEPQLGKRGLYPTISTKKSANQTRTMMNLIAYSNGKRSLLEIAKICNTNFFELDEIACKLIEADVLSDLTEY